MTRCIEVWWGEVRYCEVRCCCVGYGEAMPGLARHGGDDPLFSGGVMSGEVMFGEVGSCIVRSGIGRVRHGGSL